MSSKKPRLGPGQVGAMPPTTGADHADRPPLISAFDRFASAVTRGAGSPIAFSTSCSCRTAAPATA